MVRVTFRAPEHVDTELVQLQLHGKTWQPTIDDRPLGGPEPFRLGPNAVRRTIPTEAAGGRHPVGGHGCDPPRPLPVASFFDVFPEIATTTSSSTTTTTEPKKQGGGGLGGAVIPLIAVPSLAAAGGLVYFLRRRRLLPWWR